MKKLFICLLTFTLVFGATPKKLFSQEIEGGMVKYQEITKLDFSGRKGPGMDNQRIKDFIASLPEESKIVKTLHFTKEASLYEEIESENADVDPNVRRATFFMSMRNKPKPSIVKIYNDLEKNKTIEKLNFMTRDFIVESDIETKNWKLSPKMKKILDYTCMNASLIIENDSTDNDTIVAWFTAEIPISIGPERYIGLPGLILAVEKNRETILLASSIELTTPEKDVLVKPSEGKKVTQEELDKIIQEKVEEFKATRRQGGGGHRGGGGGYRH